jgi:hypothetical protein
MADQTFTAGQILTAAQMTSLQSNIGLVPITPTSVTNATLTGNVAAITSGQSTITLSGVFTSSFESYRVIITGLRTSAAQAFNAKLNNSTGSTYSSVLSYYGYSSAVQTNSAESAVATGIVLGIGSTTTTSSEFDVFSPFATTATTFKGSSQGPSNPSTFVGIDTNAASSANLILTVNSGSFSAGNIRVYGYR